MEATGEEIMCAGCMDIVTLIHDETHVPDTHIAKVVLQATQQAVYASTKSFIKEQDLATFLIVLGGSLLVWEKQ